jgi:hypothetical protein
LANTREKTSPKQIVPAGSGALALRSAALVARGLRDLARDSNWLVKKVFAGRSPFLAVSPAGQVCAIAAQTRLGTERAVLYDVERSVPILALSVPKEAPSALADLPASFAGSPTGRYLVGAWGAWPPALHLFDLHSKMFLGVFGEFQAFPQNLVWSASGNFFVAGMSGGGGACLRLWNAGKDPLAILSPPAAEVGLPEWIEPQQAGEEFAAEGAFRGYGRTAFSPDEKCLASVVQVEGDWADDSIVILDVPSLDKLNVFDAQGHITDLAWIPGTPQIIYCSAGQAYRLDSDTLEFEPLAFGAELCACHPNLPLCICFNSWLKNAATGRLFLANLNHQVIFDERAADGVVDLCWSADGTKAFAITQDGLGYIYEPPLL